MENLALKTLSNRREQLLGRINADKGEIRRLNDMIADVEHRIATAELEIGQIDALKGGA